MRKRDFFILWSFDFSDDDFRTKETGRELGYPDATSVLNIKYGDNIMLWRLPECEIQANPAIEESDNNPVAPQPTPVPDNN